MDSLSQPRHTMSQMEKASGVPSGTSRSWVQRGRSGRGGITLDLNDIEAPQNGMARLFTGRTVMLVAIVGALTKMGVPVEKAAHAAAHFAHTGTPEVGRDPGHLMPGASETLLVVYPREAASTKLIGVKDGKEGAAEAFESIFAGADECEPITCLPLFQLVNRVRTTLGLERDNG